jgi:hypothetical protein
MVPVTTVSYLSFSCVLTKIVIRGGIDTMFHFTCFNVEDPHDPSVGLNNGQLSIPGNLLRRRVFDPVVAQVCVYYALARPVDLTLSP